MIRRWSISKPLREDLIQRLRRLSHPLKPEPTHVAPRLRPLPSIRAVLFDVYGTMLVSGCGESGAAGTLRNSAAFRASLCEAGFICDRRAGSAGSLLLRRRIEQSHAAAEIRGMRFLEIDIREVWDLVIRKLLARRLIRGHVTKRAILTAALEYEARVNPAWPMPGLKEVLRALRQHGLILGIVSNAQFYTPLLLSAFEETGWNQAFFATSDCAWSWKQRIAKPNTALFRPVLAHLAKQHGIEPEHILYVGNDMLNDVWAAGHVGCRTALFAGDARSLRWRRNDTRLAGTQPDVILTHLKQLLRVVVRGS